MEREIYGETVKIILQEGLTANNVPQFSDKIRLLMPEKNTFNEFVLDLSNIDNIDSVGVTFVINLFKQMKGEEKAFKVARASEDIKSLFKLMKLDQFFEMIE